MIDTHTHIYLPEFDEDRERVIASAVSEGLENLWLPAIDEDSFPSMQAIENAHPGLFRLFAGLHPTELKDDWRSQLEVIRSEMSRGRYKGIGEIGLDLYWDKSREKEQEEVLRIQLDWAVTDGVPVLLHVREAFPQVMKVVRDYYGKGLRGVFHCYAGGEQEAFELIDHGFLIGVNGSITYKRNAVAEFLPRIPLRYILTETDAPYLSPVPLRGKRNEPAYLVHVVRFLAERYGLTPEEVDRQTTLNARAL